MRICVFGDSIAWGANDPEGGWVQRLRRAIHDAQGYPPGMYNLSVRGDTTADLIDRIVPEAQVRDPEKVIIAVGINDTQYVSSRKEHRVTVQQFRANLEALISKARVFTEDVTLVGLTPVEEEYTNPVPWNDDYYYRNTAIAEYNNVLCQTAVHQQVMFVDTLPHFPFSGLSDDGLHPNEEGHQFLFEHVHSVAMNGGAEDA